ncbi:diguanylate cyclase (GGDEF) domain-containing protein [Clostridium thermobutyricum]|uniref:Diguanylate cyclase (GGDEF) domain-containing protein n=1 Tax=Clostridium thermobutyricum TaxID=29372 RepID=N9WFB4_9CLOT|nr:HD domain-containing phosphohydrolase [Clostridium thermobutyricum]ENZ01575.1 diguanylate cyclase (GGDEF) domain-containing protein [Clostridium thermobutyricum]
MQLIKLLIENFPFGMWIEDKEKKISTVNLKFLELFNCEKEKILGKTFYNLLEEKKYKKEEFKINDYLEIRIYNKKNILNCKKIEVLDRDKNIIGKVGIVDCEKNCYLKNVINAIPYIISYKDINGNLTGCNKAFEKFVGRDELNLLGEKYKENCLEKELVLEIANKDGNNLKKKNKRLYEIQYENNKVMKVEKFPLKDSEGKIIGVVGLSEDISEDKKFQNKIIEESYKDKTTGLYNRNYFEKIAVEIDKNFNGKLILIMGDSDALKLVNDSLGHLEGDRYLRDLSRIILEVVNKRGDVIRWGGDEFIILIPNANIEDAKEVTERINYLCRNNDSSPIPISLSMGYSYRQENNKTLDKMIEEAENEVYKEKLIKSEKTKKRLFEYIQKSLMEKCCESEEVRKRKHILIQKICEELNLTKKEIEDIQLASDLCSIGMIAIPDNIAKKNIDELTDKEIEILKTHPDKGYRIVKSYPEIAKVSKIILTHHEDYNGKGYPLGLAGEDIPLGARIIRIIEDYNYYLKFDNKITKKDIEIKIKSQSYEKYDPKLVKVFLKVISEM